MHMMCTPTAAGTQGGSTPTAPTFEGGQPDGGTHHHNDWHRLWQRAPAKAQEGPAIAQRQREAQPLQWGGQAGGFTFAGSQQGPSRMSRRLAPMTTQGSSLQLASV